jgi:hypothetical protein
MLPFDDQKNWKPAYRIIARILKFFSPKSIITLQELGKAMINAATIGYSKPILEIKDIKSLAALNN